MKARVSWVILLLSLVFVAGRTLIAAQAALEVRTPGGKVLPPSGGNSSLAEASRRDSLLNALEKPGRDPFGPPRPSIQERARPVQKGEPVVIPPRVVLLMQDGQSTLVQIEVEGATSGWLTTGGRFRGWTIEDIGPGGITVSNGSRQFDLRRP